MCADTIMIMIVTTRYEHRCEALGRSGEWRQGLGLPIDRGSEVPLRIKTHLCLGLGILHGGTHARQMGLLMNPFSYRLTLRTSAACSSIVLL